MPMKINLISIAMFCLPLISSTAYACSCATGDSPHAFNSAKAVFIGRMLGGTEKLSIKDEHGKSRSIEAGAVRFAVEEQFKGNLEPEITIGIASMNGTSCGPYGLRRGERYIVFAYAGEEDEKTLYTGVCTRTGTVDGYYAKEDLAFLRNLPSAGTGGNLRGSIWADLRSDGVTPMPGVRVNIRSADGKVITVITDKDGRFEVNRLKPGKYTVKPDLPENYTGNREIAEVSVDDRGTADVGFETYINGRVSGRVVDQDGNGFNSVFLNFEGTDKKTYGHSTGKNGGFEVEGVPPGEFVLYLEMQGNDNKKDKNYYYPGTFDRAMATTIKVGLGEKIEGVQFLLPEEFKVHLIEGLVYWNDGKPAAGVEVMLLCPQSAKEDGFAIEFMPTATRTDEEGRFQLEGFAGEAYWIEARGSQKGRNKDEYNEVHSPSKKMVISEDVKNLKLVLSEDGFTHDCTK
jgi:SdrD B-like domain